MTENAISSTQPPSVRIPPRALAGMADWTATVVWAFAPGVTTWRLVASNGRLRYLKATPFAWQPSLATERERMIWAAARLPTPTVLDYGVDDDQEWLLTVGLPGVNAIDQRWLSDPVHLVPLLADGLRRIHALPIDDCPFDGRGEGAMRDVRQRVAAGLVDVKRDFHVEHVGLTPETALAHLEATRPEREDLVVCHGDYCLPNVLLSDGRISGYVDLGQLAVADRWWDLAIATWSLTWNLGPGWEDRFLEVYGLGRDHQKQAFYRLLHDLFP